MNVTDATSAAPAVLITGATDGLGRWLAVRLSTSDTDVILHGRDQERLDSTVEAMRAAGGREPAGTVLADLARLAQVDQLADEVAERFGRITALVNNAAVGFGAPGSPRQLSPDGIELRFTVNYLAGYHLTRRLLPVLRTSAPARVVNVVSVGQEPIDFTDPMLEWGYTGVRAYRQSKLAQIMFTIDLADELHGTGVTVNALHPASLMDTSMVREMKFTPLSTLDDGGEATLRLIIDPELDGVTGRYFDQTMEAAPHPQASDVLARRQLYELSESLIAEALAGAR
ncbi:short-subunit dehydrogenase [Haloactinopolyspora alba]|uniref:Short-subunit dehydrogenase n=1 Tax=Haloactinopolyspora alba TaxID=648780 RepID=A0A2P8EFN0_9ACTN|nr:SDR family NAD(P)-dependent oxidoreductase [Haloactinopolyspora alba]PSL08261.1 short-subunit dehydrogenase [Haloactinopolyspora alba]